MNLEQYLAGGDANLLVIAPHPDDESLGAGGLIQRARAHGARVAVAFVTDGDNNPWPQRVLERRVLIGAKQRERWGLRRREEARRALQALAAQDVEVRRLGWPDGGVTWKLVDDTVAAVSALRALLAEFDPGLLVLPDLSDRHPDHSALHVLLELALRGMPPQRRPQCLCYLLHGRRRRCEPQRIALELTPQEQARKRAAILAHASQTALSRRRLLRFAGASEEYALGVGNHDLSGPRLPWLPPRWLRPWMRLLIVDARGGQRLKLGGGGAGDALQWRDGSLAVRLPRQPSTPHYVKLYASFPSPWVFDRWGWRRFVA